MLNRVGVNKLTETDAVREAVRAEFFDDAVCLKSDIVKGGAVVEGLVAESAERPWKRNCGKFGATTEAPGLNCGERAVVAKQNRRQKFATVEDVGAD